MPDPSSQSAQPPRPEQPPQQDPLSWSLSEEQWRQRLTESEYRVLRQAGTEAPWTGEYTRSKAQGVYHCRACGLELFASDTKFDSSSGWPSFHSPLAADRVRYRDDDSLGGHRVEVRCARCGSHLGHVFDGEGFPTPTDRRYCVNSICLTLESDSEGPSR